MDGEELWVDYTTVSQLSSLKLGNKDQHVNL